MGPPPVLSRSHAQGFAALSLVAKSREPFVVLPHNSSSRAR